MRTRRILVLCVVAAVVLAGCGGVGDDAAEEDAGDAEMEADGPDDSEAGDADEVADAGSTAQIAAETDDRALIRTGTVELEEPAPSELDDPVEAWYETGVIAAFLASVASVGTAIQALVVGIGYVLPYVLAFGLPLAGVAYLLTEWPLRD